jgi:hypothetical protein
VSTVDDISRPSSHTDDAESRNRMRLAAQALDRLRREIGPVGIPVRDLIAHGRRENTEPPANG